MAEDHRRGQLLEQARHLIEAEDHESAAGIYQSLGLWKEAGEVRRNGRRQIMTQVHVNVNDLVEQVRKAGIATDYTCPACRGHIRITGDTTLAAVRNDPCPVDPEAEFPTQGKDATSPSVEPLGHLTFSDRVHPELRDLVHENPLRRTVPRLHEDSGTPQFESIPSRDKDIDDVRSRSPRVD